MELNEQICNRCGGTLENIGIGKLKCKYCDAIYERQVKNGETELLLISAYAELRKGNTADAYDEFVEITNKYPDCYEAYFGVALANHEVVYVDDYRNGHKRVPTCYHMSKQVFSDNPYYKKAIELAPSDIAAKYRKDAAEIDRIREHWLKMVDNEKPYDVFICYKESDDNSKVRTDDSIRAQEIYSWLTDKGYRVFYSRISLSDKVSENYEPYIYHALETAKVMIVYAQKPEYFNAIWLQNEWKRWWKRVDKGEKHPNSLIVAYENMDAYNIPPELSRGRTALEVSRMDFLPSLQAHIKKIEDALKAKSGNVRVELAGYSGEKITKIDGKKVEKKKVGTGVKRDIKNTVLTDSLHLREIKTDGSSVQLSYSDANILKIANSFLANRRYKKAIECYEQILEKENNADALIGTMLASVDAKTDDEFVENSVKFTKFSYFDRLMENCSKEQLNRMADLFLNSLNHCLKFNSVSSFSVEFFSHIVAYNIPQRQAAMVAFKDKIYQEIAAKDGKPSKYAKVYLDSLKSDGATVYMTGCGEIADRAIDMGKYDFAREINDRIGEVDNNDDVYLYNLIRLEVKSALTGRSVVDIFNVRNFESIENLIKNVDIKTEAKYNEILVRAVFMGLNYVYDNKRIAIKNKITDLFKTIISYSYSNYIVKGEKKTEADFKFSFYKLLLHRNIKDSIYTDKEINALLEHILTTLDENAVDEYAAYQALQVVYYINKNDFVQAEKFAERHCEIIPNDNNMRLLKVICSEKIGIGEVDATKDMLVKLRGADNSCRSNFIIYALLERIASESDGKKFVQDFEGILKYCKKEENWIADSRSKFYIARQNDAIDCGYVGNAGSDTLKLENDYYSYLCSYTPVTQNTAVFATIMRDNIDYNYTPKTQYDYIIKLFTSEIINYINDINNKKKITLLTDVYYDLLKYIDESNKTYMCERLKLMADILLTHNCFDEAEKFYEYAINENKMDPEFYWKRLHAKLKVSNTIDLILSNEKIEDEADFINTTTLAADNDDKLNSYMLVPSKQDYLNSHKKLKALLRKKKNYIPIEDVADIFNYNDDEFSRYLSNLQVQEQKRIREVSEKRKKLILQSGEKSLLILLLLASIALPIIVISVVATQLQTDIFSIVLMAIGAALAVGVQIKNLVQKSKLKMVYMLFTLAATLGVMILYQVVLFNRYDFYRWMGYAVEFAMIATVAQGFYRCSIFNVLGVLCGLVYLGLIALLVAYYGSVAHYLESISFFGISYILLFALTVSSMGCIVTCTFFDYINDYELDEEFKWAFIGSAIVLAAATIIITLLSLIGGAFFALFGLE